MQNRFDFMKKAIAFYTLMLAFFSMFAEDHSQWVDMGTRTIDDDIVYWSASDFICSNSYSGGYSFADIGEMGSTVGWGDATGQKTSTDVSDYGGNNCPKIIAGKPTYDIVTALMGTSYRLPTVYDVQQLMDNVTQSVKVIGKRKMSINGAPDWVQGQWLWNHAMLINGMASNVSISVKIDGHLASVITSDGDQWEGAWSYSNGMIHVWRLNLNVVHSDKVLRDEKGYTYKKVSDNSTSGDIKVVVLTSNINGNQLYIPMPTDFTTGTSYDGNYVIAYRNEQTHDYWTGESKNNSKGLVFNTLGAYEDYRYSHHFIRAIKVDIGSGQKAKKELLDKIEIAIGQCVSLIDQNIKLSNQLNRKDSHHDYRRSAPRSENIKNSKLLVVNKYKSRKDLQEHLAELNNALKELRVESENLNAILRQKKQNAQKCAKTVFGSLLSVSYDKTLFDYKVSAKTLNNGNVQLQIYIYANKNAEKFRKNFWKHIEQMSESISREELSEGILWKEDKGYQVNIKGNAYYGTFALHHFEKSKEQRFNYQINKESLYNNIDLSEIASCVNDSIRKAMADFSITDAQGNSYSFMYDPALSAESLSDFYLDSINCFIPLYQYRGNDISAIQENDFKNVSSVSDYFYQWINPFLVNDDKNQGLFICYLTLPYSESYIFSSVGHDDIKSALSKKHSVNTKIQTTKALFGSTKLNQLRENKRNNNSRSRSLSRPASGAGWYYNNLKTYGNKNNRSGNVIEQRNNSHGRRSQPSRSSRRK